jgi:lantibiotic transport system permease protein
MSVYLFSELMKIRRTPVWWIAFSAPAAVAVVALLMAWKQGEPSGLLSNALGLWVVLVMPMSVAAITAFIAQIEHLPHAFEHLYSLPIRRNRLFFAKALLAIGVMALMCVATVALTAAAGFALSSQHVALKGLDEALVASAATFSSALMLCVTQLWVALRVRSFLIPIMTGVIGSFVAGASLGTPYSALTPWGAPMAVLAADGAHAALGLAVGSIGGVMALIVMLIDLSRSEPAQ